MGMAATRAAGGVNEARGPVPASTPEMMSRTKYEQNWATCATPDAGPATAGGSPGLLEVAGVEGDVADRGRGHQPAEGDGELGHVGPHEPQPQVRPPR